MKIDQVAPGTMPRSIEGDSIISNSGSVPLASSTIYSSSGSSNMFPGSASVHHHSQMINHGVPSSSQKEGAPVAPSSPSNEASLLQDSPAQGGRGGSAARAELSASPGASPYGGGGSPFLGELPPGYSFAPQQPLPDQQSALRSLPSPFGLSKWSEGGEGGDGANFLFDLVLLGATSLFLLFFLAYLFHLCPKLLLTLFYGLFCLLLILTPLALISYVSVLL